MAVTEKEETTEVQRDEDSGRREDEERNRPDAEESDRTEGREREDSESEDPESGDPEDPESEEAKKQAKKRERVKGIAGGIGVFLILGLYFVWIGSEMGSHAISGTFEMWAIFGAIFLGVLALVAGGAISRRRHDD